MSIPSNYPHGCTDEQIRQALVDLSSELISGHINDVLRLSPLVAAGQSELQARIAERGSQELQAAIDTFRVSSEAASRKIVVLSWVLVLLTAVLVAETIVLLIRG